MSAVRLRKTPVPEGLYERSLARSAWNPVSQSDSSRRDGLIGGAEILAFTIITLYIFVSLSNRLLYNCRHGQHLFRPKRSLRL
jgi:hypothetical protein